MWLYLSEGAVEGEDGGGDAVPVVGREIVAAARGSDGVGGIAGHIRIAGCIRGVGIYACCRRGLGEDKGGEGGGIARREEIG